MNWIKQFVTLFLFTSGLVVRSSFGTRTKLQPAERYEFCVAQNLTESSLFSEEDKVRISKIVMETDLRMHNLKADPTNAVNAKTMLRLFAAALACVAADCDSSVRPQREEACLTALESCAEALKEPTGAEVVREMKRIFAAMNREISTLDAISDNMSATEAKKKAPLEKENKAEKNEERLKKAEVEKKEHSEGEHEAKERPKRGLRYQTFNSQRQSNLSLDAIIADKLLKSTTFKNIFTLGISQDDTVFYARSMVATALSGYRYDIIDEAMNAVTSALYSLGSFSNSRDYAFTIARSIASVIAAHELTFYADGLGIGSSLVYQLDSMLRPNSSSTFSQPSFGTASASSSGWASSGAASASSSGWGSSSAASASSSGWGSSNAMSASSSGWGSSSAVVSSQTSGMSPAQMNPSYVEPSFIVPANPQSDKAQFQSSLSHYLFQSRIISETFCSGPFPGLYEVVNSAFADYGYPISSTIATVVSNSLNMLPIEAACTQYAEVISEVVADIFDNNGLIGAADPQTITNKISDLISSNTQNNPPGNPSGFNQQTYSGSDYELNPSFSDYSYYAPEVPASPVGQYPDSGISNSRSDTPVQQQGPVLTNSTKFSSGAPPPVIQTSSKRDLSLPTELSSDGEYSPDGSLLPADGSVVTNNSWVIVNYPSDEPAASGQTNQTNGSVDIPPPIILEPGPVIPENVPVDIENASKSKVASPAITTPGMIEVTKVEEITTPVPLDTNFHSTTVMVISEVITPTPQTALKDAFENPSKLSDFLLKEMKSSLEALNVTTSNEKKLPDILKTAGNSTDIKIPQTADLPPTLKNSKPAEKSPDSLDKPLSNQTSTEIKPKVETLLEQEESPDQVALNTPKPITDEVTALVFAERVDMIVTNAIRLVRSQNLQFDELCNKLNELAPLVDLPPLDVCAELPLIDYLLHVLNAVTYSLVGEK